MNNRTRQNSSRLGTDPSAINPGIKLLISKLKSSLKSYGGSGFTAVQRKFRIVDDDNSKTISLSEFKKTMKEMNINLSDSELRMLFDHFDAAHSGSIDFEEFIQGVRDPLTERRLALVKIAFRKLDKDGCGIVDAQEIATMYDASKHPDVISGRKTKNQVLTEFLDTFDVGGVKDGMVTEQEFINYYTNLGASIDNEDYFELMIRNAWHISGGEGAAANSANRRVLVTRADGSQYVEEIKDDLGLRSNDRAGMMGRLQAQGVNASSISVTGSAGDSNSTNESPRFYRGYQSAAKTRPSTAPTTTSATSTTTSASRRVSYNTFNIGGLQPVQKPRRVFPQASQISLG